MLSLSGLRSLQQTSPGSVGWSLVSRPDSSIREPNQAACRTLVSLSERGVTCLPESYVVAGESLVGERLGIGEFQRDGKEVSFKGMARRS